MLLRIGGQKGNPLVGNGMQINPPLGNRVVEKAGHSITATVSEV